MAAGVPNFRADAVRAGLRTAMQVGLPPLEEHQPTFYMPRTETVPDSHDDEGVPFDPTKRALLGPTTSHRVPCAVEYVDNEGKVENFGIIVPAKVKITLLDEDYEVVRGFEYVIIGTNRYWYRRSEPPVGLVTVGVWTVHCQAEDEA